MSTCVFVIIELNLVFCCNVQYVCTTNCSMYIVHHIILLISRQSNSSCAQNLYLSFFKSVIRMLKIFFFYLSAGSREIMFHLPAAVFTCNGIQTTVNQYHVFYLSEKNKHTKNAEHYLNKRNK